MKASDAQAIPVEAIFVYVFMQKQLLWVESEHLADFMEDGCASWYFATDRYVFKAHRARQGDQQSLSGKVSQN